MNRKKLLILAYLRMKRRSRTRRRFGIHPMNRLRPEKGEYVQTFLEIKKNISEAFYEEKFRNYLRMSPEAFKLLLNLVKRLGCYKIMKQLQKVCARNYSGIAKTCLQKYICPEEQLVLTLVFLANGTFYRRLSFNFRIGVSTISQIVKETCVAIWNRLKPIYLTLPIGPDKWVELADRMHNRWQLSHAIGISWHIL